MPAVDGRGPRLRDLVELPTRLTAADLVDTQHGHRLRFGRQHLAGVSGERRRDDRPRHTQVTGGLHDRTVAVGDGCSGGLP
jgi:hypothetical protein